MAAGPRGSERATASFCRRAPAPPACRARCCCRSAACRWSCWRRAGRRAMASRRWSRPPTMRATTGWPRPLSRHGIRHVRGPLDDVLARFIAATADLDDGDICVRLTSDNVFPDGDFVRRLIAAAEGNGHGYAGITGGSDGLPYGLAGEAMRVGLLRQADRERARRARPRARHALDHPPMRPQCAGDPARRRSRPVRPALHRRHAGRLSHRDRRPGGPRRSGRGAVAGTVPAPGALGRARAAASCPPGSWPASCRRAWCWGARSSACPMASPTAPASRATMSCTPSSALAEAAGVSHLDTAAGYGDSEHRIGSALGADSPLGIVTKLPPNLADGEPTAREAAQRVHVAVDRSLWLLGRAEARCRAAAPVRALRGRGGCDLADAAGAAERRQDRAHRRLGLSPGGARGPAGESRRSGSCSFRSTSSTGAGWSRPSSAPSRRAPMSSCTAAPPCCRGC